MCETRACMLVHTVMRLDLILMNSCANPDIKIFMCCYSLDILFVHPFSVLFAYILHMEVSSIEMVQLPSC